MRASLPIKKILLLILIILLKYSAISFMKFFQIIPTHSTKSYTEAVAPLESRG